MKKTIFLLCLLGLIIFGVLYATREFYDSSNEPLKEGGSEAQFELQKGLVAHYAFNGNGKDDSENKNDGTFYGASFTSDKFGNPSKACNFNGVDNYISVNPHNSLNLKDSFSIAFEVKLYSSKPHHILVKGDNTTSEYSITVDRERICFNHQNKQIIVKSQTKLNLNQWYNVTVTFANSLAKIYINANYDAQGKITSLFNSHKTGLTIGSFPQTKRIWNLNGVLDEIRIYNRLLSQSEMEELNQKHN
ncbi:LamG domain-containing protein [bacterium]|nr:LamG domain-containing protein [Candidatus Elulimicrobium humile]